jgi:hypothetical protein
MDVIEAMTKAGRHYTARQFFVCQDAKDFKCGNREQIAWLAMSPMVSVSRMKAFVEDWIPPGFGKPEEFRKLLKVFSTAGMTADRPVWLVVDRRSRSMDPRDFIYWYSAHYTPLNPRPLGSPMFRYANNLMLDEDKWRRQVMPVSSNAFFDAATKSNKTSTTTMTTTTTTPTIKSETKSRQRQPPTKRLTTSVKRSS